LKNELVSIIIPCCNSGKTISRTVESAKSQTWPNIEIIIINDGSTDKKTLTLLKKLSNESEIKVYSQKNKGLPGARNAGFELANGNFILPLDSDDWLHENAIELMMQTYTSKRRSHVVYSDIKIEGIEDCIKKTFCNPFEQLFSNQLPYSMLFPKHIFKNIKPYDESFRFGLEDWDLNVRLLTKKIKFVKVSEPIFVYFKNSKGMFQSITSRKFIEIYSRIREKNSDTYKFSELLRIYDNSKKTRSKRRLNLYLLQNLIYLTVPLKLLNKFYFILIKVKARKLKFYLDAN